VGDVENIITLYNALGKALANIQQSNESVNAYQYALGVSSVPYLKIVNYPYSHVQCPLVLQVLKYAKVANEVTDRSFVFPVFSGLFVAIKFDQIEQDEECSYEQDLVAQFVEETKKLGDPVHVARALAMQAEILGRLGMFEGGLEVFEQMCKIYIPERYSSEICHQYGSDRAAQTFGLAALWQMALGEPEKALEICQRIVSQLMPKMDGRNVHNSCLIVYPILWVLKDCGYPGEARNHFDHFVVTPFQTHYGEGASTSCLPIYDPILVLLDLAAGDVDNEAFQAYLDWAADGNNLKFGSVMNNAMGHYGRCPDSISAEICLLLAQRMQPGEDKLHLIQAGLDVILEVVTLTQKKKMIIARNQVLPVYRELMALAKGLVVDDGSRQPGTSQSS
jgi:tetratricopeptide (TPR) repeat protein